ncbi:MAG: 5'-methylthioadenosine/adenosylhomocysteine nucleosidase [Eubacteriales bacterium]|jgi:adenosylhomocysteine nucleosidase|nr:5'-methylthioadenosine/adenosylhomocysteine nucleosidase [Lachnospiraceae bacterium]MDD5860527.1 5'-methylthioadenosine/adenosylhomocysteine nucleosidase [Eubacteriales bacterium]MCH4063384.1 5'-methylthioadenosine/adenosylhomocysteine nucleosidase [Lachnospiraceae bacterium]MCH4104534.1 5'-methylthioadenosine/adenosylhomocysteine nucleosidase [Lachnospiraceae bacterium]MCI1309184.1 5'-methylthioadenosine/adenosylhomocysteine nucleosidase [Lachnospiraceae bacterium]
MKIGIIGAMSAEVAALKSKMKLAGTKRRAGMEFCEGTIGNTDVVIVQSGVGKVNAGCCVQILADLFDVTHIINTGVAGSLNNDINIGDIVVSTDALYHDVDATVFGYAKGEVPQLGTASFTADEMLRASAVRAIREADPDIQVFEGRVASGDQFICDRAVKNRIRDTFHADCCEMEGAAIAQASWINGIPFVIVRAISDKADESVTVSYDEFEGKAAEHCARLVEYMVRHF